MIKRSNRSIIILICISLVWNLFTFSLPNTLAGKLGPTDTQRVQDFKVELTVMKDLRLQIATKTENIRLRIERVKRTIGRLIKTPETLTDNQINTLKDLAQGIVDANAKIRSGQEDIKAAAIQVQMAIQAKQRRELSQRYKELLDVQRIYLGTLKAINDELLSDMDQILEIKMGQ